MKFKTFEGMGRSGGVKANESSIMIILNYFLNERWLQPHLAYRVFSQEWCYFLPPLTHTSRYPVPNRPEILQTKNSSDDPP